MLIQDRSDISATRFSFRKFETRRCLTSSGLNWSGKSKAAGGSLRLTLVLFEFYLTSRQALTNSIPLSGGASDVSSFARSFRRRCSIRQGGADDVVRYTEVPRRRSGYVLSRSCFPSLSLSLPLSLSLLTYSACPHATPFAPFPPPQASLRLTGEAAEEHPFSDSYTSPIPTVRPTSPAICHSIPFRPFHLIPIVPSLPYPLFSSQCPTVFTLVTLRPLGVHPNALRLV